MGRSQCTPGCQEPHSCCAALAETGNGGELRRETTIPQIAQRLHMGSWKSLNNKLYLVGKQDTKESKSKRDKK